MPIIKMAQPYTFPAHPFLVFADDLDAWLREMKEEIANPPDRGYPAGARWPIFTETRLAAMEDLLRDPSRDVSDIVARLDLESQEGSRVWYGVRDAIHKLPAHHERLLDLIVAAHQLTPGELKEPLGFPQIFGEYTHWNPTGTEQGLKDGAAKSYLAETFMAKLTSRGLSGPASNDAMKRLSSWLERGALVLREVLESTPWDPKSVTYAFADDEDDDEEEEAEEDDDEPKYIETTKSAHQLNYTILFVHPWIAICGPAFYDACKAGSAFPSDVPGENMDNNFGVGRGYCMERWDFWRKRLEEVSETEELKAATRDLAKDCVARMREIEREKGKST